VCDRVGSADPHRDRVEDRPQGAPVEGRDRVCSGCDCVSHVEGVQEVVKESPGRPPCAIPSLARRGSPESGILAGSIR
jgi:hypothetical protein